MEIQTKISWSKTLRQFTVGETHQFKLNAKEVGNARMAASREKEKSGISFNTKTLDYGIEIKRIS
ncbi:MAG: hypothetical protein JXR82_13650 [Marinifilaceae bacterium]|nr:hypothetical protein [Marinifilaceae bacterium]